jgi:acetyl esterase
LTRLDPQNAFVLRAQAEDPAPRTSIEDVRDHYDRTTLRFAGEPEEVASVADVEGGREYVPAGDVAGTLVWIHGGGWVLGTLDAYDPLCRALANRCGARVVSVDYRLAPEHPFPVPLEDAALVLGRELASARGPVAVGGDSAGGNLAAVLARRHRGELAFQLLVYPVTDAAMATGSYAEFGGPEYGLARESMAACWAAYAPGPLARSPEASPLRAPDLEGLPPTYVVLAEADPLTDEGLDYAERLREAGVEAEARVWPGTTHGFFRWRGAVDVAEEALAEAAVRVRAAFGSA